MLNQNNFLYDSGVLMMLFLFLVLVSVLVNQKLENNYGYFKVRLFQSFKLTALFRIARISFFLNVIFALSYYISESKGLEFQKFSICQDLLKNTLKSWHLNSVVILVLSSIIYLIKKKNICENIKEPQQSKLLHYYVQYVFFLFLNCAIFIAIYFLVYQGIVAADSFFIQSGVFPNPNFEYYSIGTGSAPY